MIAWNCSGGKASFNGHSHTSECEQRNATGCALERLLFACKCDR
jgi:hypothetical protein